MLMDIGAVVLLSLLLVFVTAGITVAVVRKRGGVPPVPIQDDHELEKLNKAIRDLNESISRKQKQLNELERASGLNSATALGLANRVQELVAQRDVLQKEVKRLEATRGKLEVDSKLVETNIAAAREKEASLRASIQDLSNVHGSMLMKNAEKSQVGGFMLEFQDWEKIELEELQAVMNRLRNPVPLQKAVYELYYATKMKELIARAGVAGATGIYRLFVVDGDGMEFSYVGQSVDVGNRWVQHLKRGVGADEATAASLYPAMRKWGIDVFRWELLEACGRDVLSEREKYWGAFYAVKEVGFNKKLG